MGQGEARGVRPRTTLSSLAESLNDGRQPDGEVATNLESEIRKMYEVGGRRLRVALLATEVPASRERDEIEALLTVTRCFASSRMFGSADHAGGGLRRIIFTKP